jgi:hypothetical protein
MTRRDDLVTKRCPPCSNPTVSAEDHVRSVNLWW